MQATPVTQVWLAAPEESAAVAGLLVEFRNWWGRATPTDATFRASVDRLMRGRDVEFLLGSVGERSEAVGVCQLRYRFSVWYAAEDCWLEDLFVGESARRSGLGAALVEAALERARVRGCARVDLDVNERNAAALALYERFGFSAASGPGAGRMLLMRLRL